MANTIKFKQSAVAGKVPTTAQLALGELAVNTNDGKLFLKKSVSGTESVVEIGKARGGPYLVRFYKANGWLRPLFTGVTNFVKTNGTILPLPMV